MKPTIESDSISASCNLHQMSNPHPVLTSQRCRFSGFKPNTWAFLTLASQAYDGFSPQSLFRTKHKCTGSYWSYLTPRIRLQKKRPPSLSTQRCHQRGGFFWQQQRLGEETIVGGGQLGHALEVARHVALATEFQHATEVVEALDKADKHTWTGQTNKGLRLW